MKQTKLILKMAIQSQEAILEELDPKTRNPQEVTLLIKVNTKLDLLQATLRSLEGDHALLRTYI